MAQDSVNVELLESRATEAEERGALHEARNLWAEAVRLRRLAAAPVEFVRTASRFATVLISIGEYSTAEAVLEEARLPLGGLDKRSELFLEYLAAETLLEQVRGNWLQAFTLQSVAWETAKVVYGPSHPNAIKKQVERARIEINAGLIDRAERTLNEAIASMQSSQVPDPLLLVESKRVLGLIHLNRHEYEAATILLEDCWTRTVRSTKDPLGLTPVLHPLAIAYMGSGRLTESLAALQEVLRLHESATNARLIITLKPLGELALLNAALNDWDRAISYAKEAERLWLDHAASAFLVSTDDARGAFAGKLREFATSSFAVLLTRALQDPNAVRECLEAIWRRKGLATRWLAFEQQMAQDGRNPQASTLFNQLAQVKTAIADRWLLGRDTPVGEESNAIYKEIGHLVESSDQLEKQLATSLGLSSSPWPDETVEQISKALPAGSVLVEYLRGFRLDLKAFREQFDGGEAYFAFVLPAGDPQRIRCLDLGDAVEIDELIALLDKRILPSYIPKAAGDSLYALLQVLYKKIWAPIVTEIDNAGRVILAPDSELARVPFAALRDASGTYLVDQKVLSFVNSGSETLRHGERRQSAASVVIASSHFSPEANRGLPFKFAPLPETQTEARVAAAALGSDTRIFEGSDASMGRLLSCRSPRVLHLATHAFVLGDSNDPAAAFELGFPQRDSSLLRAGVVLHDGVVTALEIAVMNLFGTELVVLSACKSGLGAIRAGESVYGLRRSFFVAGAHRLLISLWSVSDRRTAEFMELFYTNLHVADSPAHALRNACLELRRTAAHPFFWAPFVLLGDTAKF